MAKKTKAKAKTKKKTAKKKAVSKKKHTLSKVNRVQKKKKAAKKKAAKPKKPVGAPDKYNTSFDGRAERYIARYGMNISDMAKEFKVSTALVYRWIKKRSTFADAVEAGRKLMSSEIEHGLRQVAVPHDEVTDEYETTTVTDEDSGEAIAFTKTEGKHKIKRGVVNVNAALRLLQAGDERFRPNVKLGGEVKIDVLSKLLKEIDGDQEGLPSGG